MLEIKFTNHGPHKLKLVTVDTKDIVDAEFIFNLRKRLELTQVDFAKILGTDVTTYARWETGKRPLGTANSRLLYLIEMDPEILHYLYKYEITGCEITNTEELDD